MKRLLIFPVLLLASCTVGPNYKRPVITVPATYRGDSSGNTAASMGDEKWWEVFQDETLQKLVRLAVKQNYDVGIAASRVLQAEARLGITRADQLPSITAGPSFTSEKIPLFKFSYLELQASVSYNIDFWGQYRRATEAARANLLGSQWNQKTVIATLVSNVASAYFQLRELDLELEIAQRTLSSRQESLKLTQTLADGGATSMLDVRQAQQLVETAAAAIPDLQRQIAQQEDLLSTYLGQNPGDIERGKALVDQPIPVSVPAGLPAQLLERRPDIRQAEQGLIAANAEIGVARAQLFPSVPLTGSGGIATKTISSFTPVYTVMSSITQPIFEGGRLRANVRLTEAEKQEAVLTYQKTIQTALREVSDSLVAYQRYREYREHEEALTDAAHDASRLSDMRYRGGVSSYLEVLTNDTSYFSAQLGLARARLSERLSLVEVYNTLGGGWQQ